MLNVINLLDARAYRAAKRVGFESIKSASRKASADDHGGFMIINPVLNTPIVGARFELRAEDVVASCDAVEHRRRRSSDG